MYETTIFFAGFSAGAVLIIAMMFIAASGTEPEKGGSGRDRQPAPKSSDVQETKRRWSWDPSRSV